MNFVRFVPALALVVTASLLQSQAPLRAAPSGRATSEVVLSVPRDGGMGMMPMGGAAPATPTVATAPAPKPTVIRLDYGQPHLRGRALHTDTDSLVPYDKAWRLGANGNTMLTTDVDLILGGATIPKGTYVLYAIPGRSAWSLVVQRNMGQSAMQYADSADVARISLRHASLQSPVESLTMWLIPSLEAGPARGELRFAWGAHQLSTSWSIR